YGSWFGFVKAMGDLDRNEIALASEGRAAEFLSSLETTQMTRSFKMLVLLAMLQAEQVPGDLPIDQLIAAVQRLAARSAILQKDLGASFADVPALQKLLEENPIEAWVGGKGTGGTSYFAYQDGLFRTTFSVDGDRRETFAEMVRELADWRL